METQIQKERQGEGEGKRETREENTKACSSISLLLANACIGKGGEHNEAVFGQKRGKGRIQGGKRRVSGGGREQFLPIVWLLYVGFADQKGSKRGK